MLFIQDLKSFEKLDLGGGGVGVGGKRAKEGKDTDDNKQTDSMIKNVGMFNNL